MRRIVLRTLAEKADASLWWSRSDEEFFAAGACHVLAAAFLATYPHAGFSAYSVRPLSHHRGGHLVVARDDLVFDWCGYTEREKFLTEYAEAMRSIVPEWACDFVNENADPIAWDFCTARNHRHPSQFPLDPVPRAKEFLKRFASPFELAGNQAG